MYRNLRVFTDLFYVIYLFLKFDDFIIEFATQKKNPKKFVTAKNFPPKKRVGVALEAIYNNKQKISYIHT
jgi:hypothetical protein